MSTSQAEIWDDTALIDSWNAALEEYKKYHSIKDNGEISEDRVNVEEKISNDSDDIASTRYHDGANQSSYNTEHIAENESSDDPLKESKTFEALPENNEKNSSIPISPQHLIGQGKRKVFTSFYISNSANVCISRNLVRDEGIKSLLMSWYYAGYYTGLYEGQNRT
ncbi:Survival motor neuron-like protein 1 [Erysiphe neolycopersici]|uniref:Survival motor neuron-like protein 1 n=1 Tax=Erysiphe neolycopersici TaxID=212602 RepID=A0A420HNP1_9PEZI|nr:Survival motor neuron-like protein 1 [Erysiphe neolycopersici]